MLLDFLHHDEVVYDSKIIVSLFFHKKYGNITLTLATAHCKKGKEGRGRNAYSKKGSLQSVYKTRSKTTTCKGESNVDPKSYLYLGLNTVCVKTSQRFFQVFIDIRMLQAKFYIQYTFYIGHVPGLNHCESYCPELVISYRNTLKR